jgi:WD40 repeat protein
LRVTIALRVDIIILSYLGEMPMLVIAVLFFHAAPPLPDPLPPGAIAQFGSTRLRLPWIVSPAHYSPDGRYLALAAFGQLALWDRQKERWEKILFASPHPLATPHFTPDSKFLIQSLEEVTAYQPKGGVQLWTARLEATAGLSATKEWMAATEFIGDNLWVLDTQTGKKLREFSHGLGTRPSVAAHPDPKRYEAVLFARDGTLCSLDVRTGRVQWRHRWHDAAPESWIRGSVAYDPRGKWIATAGSDRLLRLWTPEGKPARVLAMHGEPLTGLSFSQNGRLAVAFQNAVRVFEVDTGRCLSVRSYPFAAVRHVALSPDGKEYLTHSHAVAPETVDAETGQLVHPTLGHRGEVVQIVAQPGGGWLSLGREWNLIRWSPRGQESEVVSIKHMKNFAAAPFFDASSFIPQYTLSPSGKWFGVQSLRGEHVAVGDTRTGQIRHQMVVPTRENYVKHAGCFTPDERGYVAARGDGTLSRLDTVTGQRIWTTKLAPLIDSDLRGSLACSPKAKRLAVLTRDPEAGSEARAVHILRADTGRVEKSFGRMEGVHTICFINENMLIFLVQSDLRSHLLRLDVSSGTRMVLADNKGTLRSLAALSPDGELLATCFLTQVAQPTVVHVYELCSGHLVRTWTGPPAYVQSLAWSRDGRVLATGFTDSQILVWDVTAGATSSPSLDADWNALATPEGYDAAWRMAHTPGAATYLARKLRPVQPLNPKRWAAILDDLDADDFATRTQAEQQLPQWARAATDLLRTSIANDPHLEVRRRLERGLHTWERQPDTLRDHRAIFVLEQLQARALLYRLAEGAPDAELTRAAQASLERLRNRDSFQRSKE